MTGYQEILTDPSYEGQLVAMTYPQIGNVGVNLEDVESRKPFMRGFIVKDYTAAAEQLARAASRCMNICKPMALSAFRASIPARWCAICAITARRMALSQQVNANAESCRQSQSFAGIVGQDLVKNVTCHEPYDWNEGMWRLGAATSGAMAAALPSAVGKASFTAPKYFVVAYDFGIKYNILRNLAESGCQVKRGAGVDAGERGAGAESRWNFSFQRARRSRRGSLCQR